MYLDLEHLKTELAAERRKIEIARRLLKVMILRSKSELDFFLSETQKSLTDEHFNEIIDAATEVLGELPITVKLTPDDTQRLDRDDIRRLQIELQFLRR